MNARDVKMGIETVIKLNKFIPRSYQLPVIRAFEDNGYKKLVLVFPRRAGKDILSFNIMIRAALRRKGLYVYLLPTAVQARRVLFEGITSEGKRILDYIPSELIKRINIQQMLVELTNGSIIQFCGSENYDGLRGINCIGAVFSEYAYQHPQAYPTIRPILLANNGWAIFISTPNGQNHFYTLFQIAQDNPEEWYSCLLTVNDTKHISEESIQAEVDMGEISEDMSRQEYFCNFSLGAIGSYYGKYLNNMELNHQIGMVDWEPNYPVHTAWDLGVRDSTVILFFQAIGNTVNVIDMYQKTDVGLEHYVNVLQSKSYTWGKHFAPHDIQVREFTAGGLTRLEKAAQLGVKFVVAPKLSIVDGIESVRSVLPRMHIDAEKCKPLINAIRDYRKEYDSKLKVYKNHPLHDFHSDVCFTADTLVLTRCGMRPIIEIVETDEVLTLEGWRRCTKAYKTGINVQLVEVTFQDGTKVKCTPEHLFLTENGWLSAANLQMDTKIRSSLMKEHSGLTMGYTNCLQDKDILDDGPKPYIERFGLGRLAKYLTSIISTIKTEIHITITCGILSFCRSLNIFLFQSQMLKDFLLKHGKLQVSGIVLKKEESGIADIALSHVAGNAGNEKRFRVLFAENHLKRLSEVGLLRESIVMQIANPLRVESVCELIECSDVYDIGVPDTGHFSLGNGAIVHNCDALRYLCISLPKTRNLSDPIALEQRYNEARYGNQSNLPPMFRD